MIKLTKYFFSTLYLLPLLFCYALPTFLYTQKATPPLFSTYPQLKEHIAHISLSNFPSAVCKLEKLGTALGTPQLYIKKDSDCGIPFGGNKARKLEFLLGDAVACNAKGVLTLGPAGSNHACATAIYAHKLGISCICLHLPQPTTAYLQRNLLLSYLHGAELNLYKAPGEREKAIYEKNKEFKEKTSGCLYFIPGGGSNELGVIGFVNAIFELKQQIDQKLIPEPDLIYVAQGSCGTATGLTLGIKAAGLKSKVVPICVQQEHFDHQYEQKFADLYNLTSQYLNKRDPTFPLVTLTKDEVVINHKFVGEGYAKITQQTYDAIKLLEQSEGIKLDGTYTGKAFAAMIDDLLHTNIKDKVILFWNTFCSGDFADIIKSIDYKLLPQEYHTFFTLPIHSLDQGV